MLAASGSALYAAGGFTADGGTPVMLAKLDPATAALDTTFAMNAGFYPGVDAIAASGSSVYIGLHYPSGSYPLLAKLDATTGVADTVFTQPGSLDSGVTALTAFGTSVYAGGNFTQYLGRNARHFLKVDATTGTLDMTFTQPTGANSGLSSIAGQGTTIYIGGSLSTYRGQPANSITKINVASDAIDPVFAQSIGATEAGTPGRDQRCSACGLFPLCRGSIYFVQRTTDCEHRKGGPELGRGRPVLHGWHSDLRNFLLARLRKCALRQRVQHKLPDHDARLYRHA